MDRRGCLEKAIEITCVGREEQYGSPEDNFKTIAKLWETYLGFEGITPQDVAIMMSLMKIARIKNGNYKEDSFIDLAGYAACACELGDDSR